MAYTLVLCPINTFKKWNLRFICNLVLLIWDIGHVILDMNVLINFVNYIWDIPLDGLFVVLGSYAVNGLIHRSHAFAPFNASTKESVLFNT